MCLKFPVYVIIMIKYFCTLWEFLNSAHVHVYVYGVLILVPWLLICTVKPPYLRFLYWPMDCNIKLSKMLGWRKFITKITDLASLKLEVQQRTISWGILNGCSTVFCILMLLCDYFGGRCIWSVINFIIVGYFVFNLSFER